MNKNKVKATACLIGFPLLVSVLWNALGIFLTAPTLVVQGGGAAVSFVCIVMLRDFWNKKFNA